MCGGRDQIFDGKKSFNSAKAIFLFGNAGRPVDFPFWYTTVDALFYDS